MKNALKIVLFTILVTLFYSYVGQMVPQQEIYPPKTMDLSSNLSSVEMVEIGEEIAKGKGTCFSCHTIGSKKFERFPDIANIGLVSSTRREGYNSVEYLAESIYDPNAFIVDGFLPGMPPIHKPPLNLNDQEILTVIAYLQSLGSEPTVTMQTKLKYSRQVPLPEDLQSVIPTVSLQTSKTFEQTINQAALMTKYMCISCHSFDSSAKMVGPSLFDVGSRLNKAAIYEAIMDPDATIADGFTAGVMPATLTAIGFYDKISIQEMKAMANYLASRRGNK